MDSDNLTLKDLRDLTIDLEEAIKALVWEWEDKTDLTVADIALGRNDESREVTSANVVYFSPFQRDV